MLIKTLKYLSVVAFTTLTVALIYAIFHYDPLALDFISIQMGVVFSLMGFGYATLAEKWSQT